MSELEGISKIIREANSEGTEELQNGLKDGTISRMNGNKASIDSFLHSTLIKYEQDRDNHRQMMTTLRQQVNSQAQTINRRTSERDRAARYLTEAEDVLRAVSRIIKRHTTLKDRIVAIREVVPRYLAWVSRRAVRDDC